jgi:hypothetical protein
VTEQVRGEETLDEYRKRLEAEASEAAEADEEKSDE